jgi:hypothetical protein
MADTRQKIQVAMGQADSFMALGAVLKTSGINYRFSTEPPMPPAYLVSINGDIWFIVNEKYADDGSFTVNGLGLTQ